MRSSFAVQQNISNAAQQRINRILSYYKHTNIFVSTHGTHTHARAYTHTQNIKRPKNAKCTFLS